MGLSTPPPTWATIKNKPTTVAGLGLSDFNASAIAAQAGAALGGVGTYALMRNMGVQVDQGATTAGSSLRYSSADGSNTTTAPAGTWRVMGRAYVNGTGTTAETSVFLRIS